jgi:hypothetical protein
MKQPGLKLKKARLFYKIDFINSSVTSDCIYLFDSLGIFLLVVTIYSLGVSKCPFNIPPEAEAFNLSGFDRF